MWEPVRKKYLFKSGVIYLKHSVQGSVVLALVLLFVWAIVKIFKCQEYSTRDIISQCKQRDVASNYNSLTVGIKYANQTWYKVNTS